MKDVSGWISFRVSSRGLLYQNWGEPGDRQGPTTFRPVHKRVTVVVFLSRNPIVCILYAKY
jgi:hypothetical protein